VPEGAGTEKIGSADLVRVVVEPQGKTEVAIEETTPVFKTIDVRSPESIEQVRVFLSQATTRGPLKDQVEKLLALNKDLADIDQRITTTREQMSEYRARMDELHDQIFTLKAVRTAGPLMQSLEGKMQEISDRLSKATIEIVALQEKRMVARIHFQDGVADLSLEKTADKTGAVSLLPPQ
jgi:chromosome segregation ATPase